VPVSELFDVSDVAEIHWELASYTNRLAVLTNERTLLTQRIAKLEEEYAQTEAQHRRLQQQIADMEDDEERPRDTRRKRKGK
jgi:cell division protein FtsB